MTPPWELPVELARVCGCAGVVWTFGRLFAPLGARLVGEILAGAILGAHGLRWLPFESSLAVLGKLCLLLIVAEGAAETDLVALRRGGFRILGAGLASVLVPLFVFGGSSLLIPGVTSREALLMGTALSSTSIAVALSVLAEVRDRVSASTRAIVCGAALLDDLLALLLLSIVSSTANDTSVAVLVASIFAAVCTSVVLVAGSLCVVFALGRYQWVCDMTALRGLSASSVRFVSLGWVLLWSLVAGFCGASPLLGAFAAGLTFAAADTRLRLSLGRFMAPPLGGLAAALFFASAGAPLPLDHVVAHPRALALGLVLTVPAILSKMSSGLFLLRPHAFRASLRDGAICALSMVARGEIGVVILASAYARGILSETAFVAAALPILLSTLFSPLALSLLFRLSWGTPREGQTEGVCDASSEETPSDA